MVNSLKYFHDIIMEMMSEGPEFLIQHIDSFEYYVEEFINRAWRFPMHVNYINALNRLKVEIQSKGPFIYTTGRDLYQKQCEVQKLIDEGLDLKEGMMIHALSLAAFFHEETMIDMHKTACEIEAAKLAERKSEIKGYIQENILELVEKRRSQEKLKMKMTVAARALSELMEQMEVVEEYNEIIEEVWNEAFDAAGHM